MESPVGKLIYCCISKNNRILFSYNGGDQTLETLASLCIEKTPPFHSHYFHTAGTRTFAFLIDDDDRSPLTCFAITDHSLNKPNLLHLLHQIKNRFKSNTNLDEEILPILRRLISSLESINRSNNSNSTSISNSYVSIDGSSSSTEAPLLGIERKNSAVKVDGVEKMETSVNPESLVQKSSSFSNRNRQVGRRLWWRHVKIVVVADLFICLILFGIWLAVCRGFRCVSQ